VTDALPLTPAEQHDLLGWMLKGASPLAACQQLEVDVVRFWITLQSDAGFAAAVKQVYDALGQNVVAGLYRAAMEGNVVAQQFWLKTRPVPAWTPQADDPNQADSTKDFTHDELFALIDETEADLALARAQRAATPADGTASGGLPPRHPAG